MEICSEHHEEIVYDSRDCPLCESLEEIKNLNETIEELNKNIES